MNWFDILKIDPEFMLGRESNQEPVRELEAPDSKVIDMERAAEMDVAGNCCEQARNQVLEILANQLRRYETSHHSMDVDPENPDPEKRTGRLWTKEEKQERIDKVERNARLVADMKCKELLQFVYDRWLSVLRVGGIPDGKTSDGKNINPELLEYVRIYEEWLECDKDVV